MANYANFLQSHGNDKRYTAFLRKIVNNIGNDQYMNECQNCVLI